MKVFVFFAAVLAVAGAINPAAIYRSQCSEGASYWCQSATHADECGAVEYCIQNFWRGRIVQEWTTCSDCEAFVNAIHNVLEQTSVQTEIIDGGKQACIVMGSLSDLCQTLVETLGAEVLQKLVSELSADEVCMVLQFCQEKTSLQTNKNGDVCTLCKDVMAEANAFLSNVTIQQDVENMLLQFCPLLSAFLPNCAQLIQDEFPVVIQFLLTYLNPDSCSEIGLCTGSKELQNLFIQIMKLKNREGVDLCSTCKTTIGTIDSMLNNAAIQKVIVLELGQLCYTLGPIAPVCVYAVNTYTKQIISAIVKYLNPDSFCSEFRFCPSDQNVHIGNDPCADCKAFFGDVDGLLTNQTVQNMITAAIDDICAQMGDFADQCKSYVDQYAYLVFDFLASELSPQEICTDINFCTSTPERKTNLKGVEKKFQPRGPSKICTDCEQFFTDVQTKLNNPNVQNTIVNAIENVCTLFGPSADECRSYVEQYGDLVIQFIVSSIDPDTVCNDIGFCMSAAQPSNKKWIKFDGPSKVCTDCEKFFTDVQTKLNDPNVQNTIINAIENVCTLFGPSADECRSYVEQYGDLVIQFIVSSIDPDTVCNDIGFCMSAAQPSNKKWIKFDGPSKVCTDCEKFFTDVQTKLNDPNVQNTIINAIENVCTLFGPSADECRSYVEQYGNLVIQFIVSSIDPNTVCNDIGFCMSATRPTSKKWIKFDGPSKVCTDCENFFTDLQTKLNDPNVQNTIINAIENVCTLFGASEDECRSYVEQYGDLVVQFIVSSVDPDTVCNDIGLCKSASLLRQKLGLTADTCTDCKAFFGDIDSMLTNTTVENMITANLLLLCDNFGSLADECKSYVNEYATLVYSLIASQLNPDQICATLQFCPAQIGFKIKKPRIDDSQVCTLCESVISGLETYVSSQANQAFIVQQLDNIVCANLGPIFSVQCKSLVKIYTPIVINFIVSNMDPKTICTEINLCQGTSTFKIKTDPQFCSDCKAFLGDVDSMLSNSTFQAGVLAQIEGLCAMAGSLEAECKVLIETYGPTAFAFILAQLDPTTDCTTLGFCPASSAPVVKLGLTADTCTDCKAFFGDIDSMLTNTTVENMITVNLLLLCDNFGSLADECKSYVNEYATLVYSLIASQLNPDQICATLQFCPAQIGFKIKEPRIDDSQVCTFCESVISGLETYVSSQANQAFIVQQLDNIVCANLGPVFSIQCKSLVKIYTPIVINFILSNMDPKTICTEINLCQGTSTFKSKTDPQLCSDCKNFLSDIDAILSNQTLENEILAQLEALCSMAGTLQAECVLLVKTYGPAAFSYLLSELDPTTFCTEVGVCPGNAAPVLAPPQAISLPAVQPMTTLLEAQPIPRKDISKANDADCDFCKTIVGLFLPYIESNATEEEVLNAVEKACDILTDPTLVKECQNYVHTYGSLIFELLKNELTPEGVCTTLGECTSFSRVMASKPVQHLKELLSKLPTDGTFCTLCEIGVGELETILSSNKSKEEIIQEVEKFLCGNLPSPINSQCLSFMEIYGDVLVQLLIEQLEPSSFCAEIGLCDAHKQVMKRKMPPLKASTECTVCEFMISELDHLITENSTEAEIHEALDKVCSLLPSTVKSECDSLINEYAEDIVKYLLLKYNPEVLCTALGICDAGERVALSKKTKVDASEQCILCEYIMSEVDKILTENSTEVEIQNVLDEVCSHLPSTLQSECTEFVNTYTSLLISYLTQQLDPKQFCTTIGECQSANLIVKKPTASAECAICEFVLAELDTVLKENATQEEIKTALEDICDLLPSTVRTDCVNFVNTYEPLLIKLLVSESPDQICTLIALCSQSSKALLDTIECDLCQTAVREFMITIQETSVTKEIVAIINETCAILPDDTKAKCYSYVDQYGDLVTQFIAQFFDPITTCTLLEACPYPDNSPRPPKQLLGQHECTRGPGYWCASMDNAKQCNMVEHCQRHVWN